MSNAALIEQPFLEFCHDQMQVFSFLRDNECHRTLATRASGFENAV
jgi:hypothetical protein